MALSRQWERADQGAAFTLMEGPRPLVTIEPLAPSDGRTVWVGVVNGQRLYGLGFDGAMPQVGKVLGEQAA